MSILQIFKKKSSFTNVSNVTVPKASQKATAYYSFFFFFSVQFLFFKENINAYTNGLRQSLPRSRHLPVPCASGLSPIKPYQYTHTHCHPFLDLNVKKDLSLYLINAFQPDRKILCFMNTIKGKNYNRSTV